MDDAPAAGGLGDWPKASIGNYKGVMLCNRPNEFGQQKKADRNGVVPFNPNAKGHEPIGWNPCHKLMPGINRKKQPKVVLLKHRQYLKELEAKKAQEREELRKLMAEEEEKLKEFKENAQKQREKIRNVVQKEKEDD